MSVVDLSGKPIDEAPPVPNLANTLKDVLRRVEDGTMAAENFYLIVDCGTKRHSFDNGLTADQAITMLEREKFHILCAIEGVKL